MPQQIKIMGYFELVIAAIGFATSLSTYLELFSVSSYAFNLNLGLGVLVVYFSLHALLGVALLKGWRYAAPLECVFSLLRMATGLVMLVWGLWVIYVFIFKTEVRAYSGIPSASNP